MILGGIRLRVLFCVRLLEIGSLVTMNLSRKFSTEIATVIKPLLADQAALNQIPLRVPYRVLTVPFRLLVLPRESQQQQYLSIDEYIAAALWLHFCFVNIKERTI